MPYKQLLNRAGTYKNVGSARSSAANSFGLVVCLINLSRCNTGDNTEKLENKK